jgi:type II secretory pathway component PulM
MASRFAALSAPTPVTRWWATKTANERRAVVAVAAIALAALAWGLVWQPLVRDIAAMRVTQTRDASALSTATKMANEIAGLARTSAAAPATIQRAGLERVLSQQGLRTAVTQLEWQEGRARLVFADVNFDALVAALEALQRDAGLRVVEGTLTARVEPGAVRAELAVAR